MSRFLNIIFVLFVFSSPFGDAIVTSSRFKKSVLPNVFTSCMLTNVSLPSTLKVQDGYYCSMLCIENVACNAFCVTASSCLLLSLTAVFPGVLPSSSGGTGDLCYVPVPTSRPTPPDLARGKPVNPAQTWNNKYAAVDTVVSSAKCEKVQEDCFCSTSKLLPRIVVDLGSSQPVATVVVTVSSFYPNYFQNVEVRVGSLGSRFDPMLTKYTANNAGSGDVLTLTGSMTLNGRYVSLIRDVFLDCLCLCLMQVYSI